MQAEFEQALLNAVTPLVRKDVYMQLYAPLINSAGCLAWLRHSKSMMADVVKYCSTVVIIPGQTLFERGDEIKHICFLQMGGVDAEELAQEMVDEIKSRESLPSIVADSEEDAMSSEGLSENASIAIYSEGGWGGGRVVEYVGDRNVEKIRSRLYRYRIFHSILLCQHFSKSSTLAYF